MPDHIVVSRPSVSRQTELSRSPHRLEVVILLGMRLGGRGPGAGGAYDAFARAYDAYTADYEYDRWIAMVLGIAGDLGLRGREALDAACGTANSTLPLIARGLDVSACDLSPAMVAEARRKLPDRRRVGVADMRDARRSRSASISSPASTTASTTCSASESCAPARRPRPLAAPRRPARVRRQHAGHAARRLQRHPPATRPATGASAGPATRSPTRAEPAASPRAR